MTNKVVFDLVVKRAKEAQHTATSLVHPVRFETAAANIIYADNRIKELEAQIAKMNEIANKCGLVFDMDMIEHVSKV